MRDQPFFISEVQYKYGGTELPASLPGFLKLGAFADLGHFDDQQIGNDGLSLAHPGSNGIARQYNSNQGIYAVIDQQIYRAMGPAETNGIHAFTRVAGLPSDRNLVSLAIDAGLRFVGVVAGRPNDEFGIAAAYNRISSHATGIDIDRNVYSGTNGPVRNSEVVGELTYKVQLSQGWVLQPDLQYIWRPGGNAPNPQDASKPVDNAFVVGIRSTVNY